MRKILILYILSFALFATTYAHSTESLQSPNGKWTVFVKRSNYTVPNNCFYFFSKGEHADEIWIMDNNKKTKTVLVSPNFDCNDVSKMILDPHNLQFSPDGKTLYFETSAWITSGAIHAIDTNGKHLRFVTPGSELQIVRSGPYNGYLIVNQHRYRFKGDTPLGSYNAEWLFTPMGKRIKLYKQEG